MFTENSNLYTTSIANDCKYRLPCGWCDRKNCVCTYPYVAPLYTTASNATSSSESIKDAVTISDTVASNVKASSDSNGFINTTEAFLKG